MNKYILLILLLSSFFCHQTSAQVPHRFNYQIALRDAGGDVAANEAVTLRFTIRHVNGGSVAYQEKHDVLTNEFGLVNVDIGTGDVLQFSWNNLIWEGFDYLLQVEVDLGNGFVDMGTSAFDSVPFSILSEKAINMNLGDLYDVETFMGVSEGDVLRFNADENWWEPQPLPAMVDGVWSSNATHAWRIGGNVGIGTATPQNGLHLHNKQGLRLTTTFTGSTFLDGFYIGQDSDNSNVYLANFENGPITFQTNFGERMRIAANGNIGIGITTPVAPLHLANTTAGGEIYTKWTSTASGHSATDGARAGINTIGELVIEQMEDDEIHLKRNGTNRLTVTNAGVDVNGTLSANSTSTESVNTVDVYASDVTTFNVQALSLAGGGNRPVYTNNFGELYPAEASAYTQYISVPGVGFHAHEAGTFMQVGFENNSQNPAVGSLACIAEGASAFYPVMLPHGATITSFEATFQNNTPQAGLEIHFYACNNNGVAAIISLASTDYPGYVDDTPNNNLVDNTEYTYLLVLEHYGVGVHDSDDLEYLWLNMARIGYTLP